MPSAMTSGPVPSPGSVTSEYAMLEVYRRARRSRRRRGLRILTRGRRSGAAGARRRGSGPLSRPPGLERLADLGREEFAGSVRAPRGALVGQVQAWPSTVRSVQVPGDCSDLAANLTGGSRSRPRRRSASCTSPGRDERPAGRGNAGARVVAVAGQALCTPLHKRRLPSRRRPRRRAVGSRDCDTCLGGSRDRPALRHLGHEVVDLARFAHLGLRGVGGTACPCRRGDRRQRGGRGPRVPVRRRPRRARARLRRPCAPRPHTRARPVLRSWG